MSSKNIETHDRLFRLYRYAFAYIDLLECAGNYNKAGEIRELCESVAVNHDLDNLLNQS